MKSVLSILTFVFCALTSLAQNENLQFCAKDTSEHKEVNSAHDGSFDVEQSRHGNYYKNDQYKFMIPKDSLSLAFKVVSKVADAQPENGVYEMLGSFYADDLHAPTTTKDAFEKDKYATTWAFKKYIEIWYNGEYIKLVFPKLTNDKHETEVAFKHSFYIHKDCYQDMLNAFKPINK
jgi:hypothetical protein